MPCLENGWVTLFLIFIKKACFLQRKKVKLKHLIFDYEPFSGADKFWKRKQGNSLQNYLTSWKPAYDK
jgi:hypothetical protein